METEVGQFSAELLKDFLQKSEAVHTLHVFSLELPEFSDTKSKFAIGQDPTPGLFKIIKDFKAKFVPSQPNKEEKPEARKEEAKKSEPKREDNKAEDEQSDNYTEDFEEDIEEDIEIMSQDTGKESQRYFESVGSSGGVDPSVDSLALDQCDYLENVKKPKN